MEKNQVTIKIAGDSGDGIQLTGHRLALIHALFGNDVATFSDYPAEIRAPKGTVYGVSAYKLQIGSQKVFTPGDELDILVAFNPAALQVCMGELKKGGTLIVDENAFNADDFKKIGLQHHPLEAPNISEDYHLARIPMQQLLDNLFAESELKKKQIHQTKNFFALGMICWLLSRSISNTASWVEKTFSHIPDIAQANLQALSEGYTQALVREMLPESYSIPAAIALTDQGREQNHKASKTDQAESKAKHRFITGNSALALGLIAAAEQSKRQLFCSSYPITPASSILQTLASYSHPQLTCFQAEDEISAIGSALGAAYGGSLAAVATSGPGFCLMSEFLGLAVMTELPLVSINIQRAGPSTGMPTKTEQSDLFLALWGRSGDAPVVVLAPYTPSHAFECVFLACRIALERTCAVVVLSDAYLAHGHEIWPLPDAQSLPPITTAALPQAGEFAPYQRHPQTLARHWAVPGQKGYEHVIGGLEKTPQGSISYEAANHQHMTEIRRSKVQRTAELLPPLQVQGHRDAQHLIIGWGSTYGALSKFAEEQRIAHVQLLSLGPLQKELATFLNHYPQVMVIESNSSQALSVLRAAFPQKAIRGIGKNDGQPWSQKELASRLEGWLPKNKKQHA